MNRFRRQFAIGVAFLAISTVLLLMVHQRYSVLPNYAYLSGWVLFGFMVLLAVYNARKKLPFLPLGGSENWLQVHIYAGFFTVGLFLVHVRFRLPTGWFEGTLAALYLLVAGSGVVGLVLSRVLPRRLAAFGGEVIYEKIPALRHALRQEVESIALGSGAKSPALADLYVRQLHPFFAGARNFWPHLFESRRPLNTIIDTLNELRRYSGEQELNALNRLGELVRQKDGLDYHFALQTTLKLWLFVHLPLTYSLMIFSLVHIILVFAFSGGAR